MPKEFRIIWRAVRGFLRRTLSIREGANIEATIAGIQKDIQFRGPTAWILMFSIFIASIGLNSNSPAVIIGAMLISPLMGPILGIGLAVGTNDFETLFKSLKNLGIAVGLSLLTSTLYFMLTPLDIEQTELLARTKPTILDVLVALFGGLAGIVAGSRKEKSSVIPGVAIATALMPPLCTAGYGLAAMKPAYFFGAFYLFFINSVFISLATFLVVKYLKFPLVSYLGRAKLKRYRIIFYVFLIVTILPSALIFWGVIQETRFKIAAERFVTEKCRFEGTELINSKILYADTASYIDLYFIGDHLNDDKIFYLRDMLGQYGISGHERFSVTNRTELRIHQQRDQNPDFDRKISEMNSQLKTGILEDLYTRNQDLIKDKELKIELLENEVMRLKNKKVLPLDQLKREIRYQFHGLERISYAEMIELNIHNDSVPQDTVSAFLLQQIDSLYANDSAKNQQLIAVEQWLRIRLNDPTLRVFKRAN